MLHTEWSQARAETMIWRESVTEKVTGNAQPGACADVLPRCYCFLCYSPIADPATSPRGPISPCCYNVNKPCWCSSCSCPVPHVCSRCRFSSHPVMRCRSGQDSALQRPRQEIKCLNSLALSNPFSVFSLCSEFTYQEVLKYCSRFDLLTYWMCVIFSQPGFRTTAGCYTSVL